MKREKRYVEAKEKGKESEFVSTCKGERGRKRKREIDR